MPRFVLSEFVLASLDALNQRPVLSFLLGAVAFVLAAKLISRAADITQRGWSRATLATRAGVSDMTVYRFFAGAHRTAPTAKKIADALGVPVARYLQTRRSVR